MGGSSDDGLELEGTSEGEVGADLEDGVDRDDEVADIMGARLTAYIAISTIFIGE